MNAVAIIPARAGSQRIPGKNMKPLGGRPLIEWTIDAASNAQRIHRVVVTTEDNTIRATATSCGVDVVPRPALLAESRVPSRDVVRHALDALMIRTGYIVLLHPTSPFRTAEHIDLALEMLMGWKGSVVSFTNDCLNGAIYAARAEDFLLAGSFMRLPILPLELDAKSGIDIDTPDDWATAEAAL